MRLNRPNYKAEMFTFLCTKSYSAINYLPYYTVCGGVYDSQSLVATPPSKVSSKYGSCWVSENLYLFYVRAQLEAVLFINLRLVAFYCPQKG